MGNMLRPLLSFAKSRAGGCFRSGIVDRRGRWCGYTHDMGRRNCVGPRHRSAIWRNARKASPTGDNSGHTALLFWLTDPLTSPARAATFATVQGLVRDQETSRKKLRAVSCAAVSVPAGGPRVCCSVFPVVWGRRPGCEPPRGTGAKQSSSRPIDGPPAPQLLVRPVSSGAADAIEMTASGKARDRGVEARR